MENYKERREISCEEIAYINSIEKKYNKDTTAELIKELEIIIKDKGREINTKNNKISELKKELTICKDRLRRKTQSNRDLQHRVHNVNTKLAIDELEKVKMMAEWKFNYIADVVSYIDKQLKDLKGENNEI